MMLRGIGSRLSAAVMAALAFAFLSVSCQIMPSQRYIRFVVEDAEVSNGDGTYSYYQACEEIRGALSGKILKRVASPGGRIVIESGNDYDFRLIMKSRYNGSYPWIVDTVTSKNYNEAITEYQEKHGKYQADIVKWEEDYAEYEKKFPGEATEEQFEKDTENGGWSKPVDVDLSDFIKPEDYVQIVRLGPKSFRLLNPMANDDLIITVTGFYTCVFQLDDSNKGVTDRIEKISFCLNDVAYGDYAYPVEMPFPSNGKVTYAHPITQDLKVRLYLKSGEGYEITQALNMRGAEPDSFLEMVNSDTWQADGYCEYVIGAEKDADGTYSAQTRNVRITTGAVTTSTSRAADN